MVTAEEGMGAIPGLVPEALLYLLPLQCVARFLAQLLYPMYISHHYTCEVCTLHIKASATAGLRGVAPVMSWGSRPEERGRGGLLGK